MPSGEPFVGPDAIVNSLYVKLATEWDGFWVPPHRFHGAGDSVIVEARYSGMYKKAEKPMDSQVCHIWDVVEVEITRFHPFMNTATYQDVMGVR
jgi:uncharacterized protein